MNTKYTLWVSALMTLTTLSAQAAVELTPQQAAERQPFERITLTGRFNSLGEAANAVSRRADSLGAASYYIQDSNETGNGGNWRVIADVYRQDAAAPAPARYRMINGVAELPKAQAYALEPYDTVTVSGLFHSQPDALDAITKRAKERGAASFFIVRQVDTNRGGNQRITAFIYKADAKPRASAASDAASRDAQTDGAPPTVSRAATVAIPGVAASPAPASRGGSLWETASSTGERYTVTLPDGRKIEEINRATAAQRVPFDTISFTGHFGNTSEVSYQVAKRAAKRGANAYHITRQWQERGGNLTVSADLYR